MNKTIKNNVLPLLFDSRSSEPVGQLHRPLVSFLCIYSACLVHQILHRIASLPQRYSFRCNGTASRVIHIHSKNFRTIDIFV